MSTSEQYKIVLTFDWLCEMILNVMIMKLNQMKNGEIIIILRNERKIETLMQAVTIVNSR